MLGVMVSSVLSMAGAVNAHPFPLGEFAAHIETDTVTIGILVDTEMLQMAVGIDSDGDNVPDTGALNAAHDGIVIYGRRTIRVVNEGYECDLQLTSSALSRNREEVHLLFEASCGRPLTFLTFECRFLMDMPGGVRYRAVFLEGERSAQTVFSRAHTTYVYETENTHQKERSSPRDTSESRWLTSVVILSLLALVLVVGLVLLTRHKRGSRVGR